MHWDVTPSARATESYRPSATLCRRPPSVRAADCQPRGAAGTRRRTRAPGRRQQVPGPRLLALSIGLCRRPRVTVLQTVGHAVPQTAVRARCRLSAALPRRRLHAPHKAGAGSRCLDCWPCALGCAADRACYRPSATLCRTPSARAADCQPRCGGAAGMRRRQRAPAAGA